MKIAVALLFLAIFGTVGYGLYHNPGGCQRLAIDVVSEAPAIIRDVAAIYTQTTAPADNTSSTDNVSGTTTVASIVSAVSGQPAPAPAPIPIPSQPNWTWTTSTATYHNVKIVKLDADCVTIIHSDGGGLVRIADLPPDIQQQLHYNPDAAAKAAAQRTAEDNANAQAMNAQSELKGAITDYQVGLNLARAQNKQVMLHFTGSDWCAFCKYLDREVLSSDEFARYVGPRYVVVTLDFPHDSPQSQSLKQQNAMLSQKYSVTGYPSLVVIDTNEKVLARTSGYNPGSGVAAVIQDLQH